jgi:hypothetical protein
MLCTSAVGLANAVKALDQPSEANGMAAGLFPQRQNLLIV